jgi:hypothetical protein
MQSGLAATMELVSDYILMRRPTVPLRWDSVGRPHVALLVEDPITGTIVRYYLSQAGAIDEEGFETLDIVDIDDLAEDLQPGSLLEVRFNATCANLYKLEDCGGIPCWRWIAKYRGLQAFDIPSPIDWDEMILENRGLSVHDSF